MAQEVDGHFRFDFQPALAHQLLAIQIGSESDPVAEGGNERLKGTEDRVLVAKVVQKDEVSALLADPLHFFNHHHGVGDHGDEIGGKDSIEAAGGKIEPGRVHFQQLDIFQLQFRRPEPRLVQHLLGQVDPRYLDVSWEHRKGEAGSHAHFQEPRAGRQVQQQGGNFPPTVEDGPEQEIVETGVPVVNLLDAFDIDIHKSAPPFVRVIVALSPPEDRTCLCYHQAVSQGGAEGLDVLIEEAEIRQRVAEMARRIEADYEGREPHFVGVLKGAAIFHADLVRKLALPLTMDFVSVSSYGAATSPVGPMTLDKDLEDDIEGKDVILVEDIVDTGRTAAFLFQWLPERKPASVKLCAFLSKSARRRFPAHLDYVGFDVPDRFVVGYGLDYNQMYRNLPYIAALRRPRREPPAVHLEHTATGEP